MNSEIIAALIGIVATIIGTFLGWMLNNQSRKGKINIYVSSWEEHFIHKDYLGGTVDCNKRSEVEHYTYKLSLNLYNSSADNKIMRDIKICFSDENHDLKQIIPLDDSKKIPSMINQYDKVKPINIPPKKYIHLYTSWRYMQ